MTKPARMFYNFVLDIVDFAGAKRHLAGDKASRTAAPDRWVPLQPPVGEEAMAKLYIDNDKYGDPPASPVVDAYHSAIKDLIRRRLDEIGGDWASFVFDKSYDLDRRQGIRRDREEAACDRPSLRLVGDDLGARTARRLQSRRPASART